jgi:hypothetical protein
MARSIMCLSIVSPAPLPPTLHTLEFTSDNIQPIMSSGYIQYPFSEITDPMMDDPCCPPPLPLTDTPSPELFDEDFDNNEEVSEFDLPPDQVDALFSRTRNTNPDISTKISTLSAFTDSTDSSYELASSQYSFDITSSESDYLNPSEFENRCSVNSELQPFISSAEFTDPLPYIPPLNSAESHGTMGLDTFFLRDDSSTTTQQLESVTCVDPAALTVHMISDAEAQMTPFNSPHSPFCKSEPICVCIWLTLLASFCAKE